MSNWTHVAGIVRIDDIQVWSGGLDIERIFGKTCLFDDSNETWADMEAHPDQYLPMGSEGSLKMSVWRNPNKEEMTAYTVSIFGDLRDYDCPDEIVNWFKAKLKGVNVRQAVITVENEKNGTITWTYEQ